MNFIERLKIHQDHRGRRRLIDERLSSISLDAEIDTRKMAETFIYRYRLTCQLGIVFHATAAEYDSALLNAKQMILRDVYSDVHACIQHAVAALYAGDRKEALDILSVLQKEIGG